LASHEHVFQAGGSGVSGPGRQFALRVNRLPAILASPAAKNIEVLQTESQRVHFVMAGGAFGFSSMGFELRAQRQMAGFFAAVIERGDVWRRRVDLLTEQSF